MKKANVQGLEKLAAGFLQHRFGLHLRSQHFDKLKELPEGMDSPDFIYYAGACKMIEAMGGEWRRYYHGGDSQEDLDNIKNYHHVVILPSDETCSRLNFDAWE